MTKYNYEQLIAKLKNNSEDVYEYPAGVIIDLLKSQNNKPTEATKSKTPIIFGSKLNDREH